MKEPEHWKIVLIVVPIVGSAIATLVFLLRLYCRRLAGVRIKAEDYFMGIGLVFTYGVTACFVILAFNGVGLYIWDLPREERLRISLLAWISQKFWPPAQVFVKVSIVLFLRRLLGTLDRFRHVATAVIIFTIVWGTTAVIGNTFQCWPPQYFWMKHIDGHCMSGQTAFFMVMGSLSLVEDLIILCLPMPVVWRLQMATRQKIEMSLIFSIGALVCAFSLLRIVYFRRYDTDNVSATAALESIWTVLELDVAIICGSLLLMKPLFKGFLGLARSGLGLSSRKNRSYNSPRSLMFYDPEYAFTGVSHDAVSEVRSEVRTVSYGGQSGYTQMDLEMGRIYIGRSINQDMEYSDAGSVTGMSARRGSGVTSLQQKTNNS